MVAANIVTCKCARQPEISAPAGILLVLLERGPRTWRSLHECGFGWQEAFTAVAELALVEKRRVCVGPEGLWLAEGVRHVTEEA